MKLSISWIFDHIDASWQSLNISTLVDTCIRTTAEIEGWYKVTVDVSRLFLAQVIKTSAQGVVLRSPELHKEITLPTRIDSLSGQWFLVLQDDTTRYRWATAQDMGGAKEHVLPALHCQTSEQDGSWKQAFPKHDYILELDNKSITHRPDLWGHRGFAREVAAILNVPLKPLRDFIVEHQVIAYEHAAPESVLSPIGIENRAQQVCKRYGGVYIDKVTCIPSLLWMMHRLCLVDSKPINALIDTTNYVMFDMGQPLHAFDATTISGNTIHIRFAHADEKLMLLDGSILTLTSEDLVIADTQKPLALAGVMGGSLSGVRASTMDLFIEAACFDAVTIRHTAMRHKQRTESSARFEKSLDPHAVVPALERYISLLYTAGIVTSIKAPIVVCGKDALPCVMTITHHMIEQRLGVELSHEFITKTLRALAFIVDYKDGVYTVTVPTFRATKDINVKEDIVEEVGRFYGYTNLIPVVPMLAVKPSTTYPLLQQLRMIKELMAYGLSMKELYSYSLYDEEYLRQLSWEPHDAVTIKNPISEHWRRLVTSLMPHLFKAVQHNAADNDTLRFFEMGRIWHMCDGSVAEKKSLAAIIFSKTPLDFYTCKAQIQQLFDALGLTITWHKVSAVQQPWVMPYQTAALVYDGTVIGTSGMVNPLFMRTIAQGNAFIIELNGDFLMSYKHEVTRYVPPAKYPIVVRDISILIPIHHTADEVIRVIQAVDEHIIDVVLVDFFEKPEWIDQRSLTLRLSVQDAHKTMTKDEVDVLIHHVTVALQKLGATIR